MSRNSDKTTIQSVDRAIEVLRCFLDNEKLGVTEVSKRLGLHKSTTFGLINTLHSNKFLEQDSESGKYYLGIEILRLSANVHLDIRDISLPFIKQLVETLGETVNLVVRDDECVIYIEKQESPHSMRICTNIGQRMPMYSTGVGKAMLAFMDPEEQDEILKKSKLIKLTQNTLVDKSLIKENLLQVRKNGYAVDDEELEYGLVCIAVPVLNLQGRPVAAISCSGPKQRMTKEKKRLAVEKLLDTASAISKKLF